MDKIDVMRYLIQDAKKEADKLKEYVQVRVLDSEKEIWNPPAPTKQRLKDDLKMIRRLSLELEKESDKLW